MNKSVFQISKMDCPSEERIIRMKLDGVESIKSLEFDIPLRRMTAFHEGDPKEILELITPLNFGATLKESEITETQPQDGGDPEAEAKVLKTLLVINGGMFFVELAFGIYAESMGLISDSLDMLADASVYMISLYAVGKTLQAKKKSARVNGILQIVLGIGVLIETVRRFIYGSEPEPSFMVIISFIALAANVYCLYLLSSHKEKGAHMKASYICSSTDVMANSGVILAGLLVYVSNSSIPDLVIGIIVAAIVLRGASSILKIS